MRELYLRCFLMSIFTLHCTSQTVFDCPKQVVYGKSANLTCSIFKSIASINNPQGELVGSCNPGICTSIDERSNITLLDENRILMTVHLVNKEDEGEWTCQSGDAAKCFLNISKLPSCEIHSNESTNDLTIGQDLLLNINLSDYYCTNSIAWNLQIGGIAQNITEFREVEETDAITNKAVTYSPTVTSSLTGRMKLTFNCNDETYVVSCRGVEELKLRDPPFCLLTSDDDTDTLTIGKNLTLQAAIEEYPCTTGIEYALLSGSLMIAGFVASGRLFSATLEVKQEYLNQQLHLKYTCNNVSDTIGTTGVTIHLTEGEPIKSSASLAFSIGLPVRILLLAALLGILITFLLKRRRSSSTDTPLYDVPSHDTNTEVRYQNLIRNDDTSSRTQELQNIPDVDYQLQTPQPAPETHAVQHVNDDRTQNVPSAEYEYIDNVEQAPITERRTCKNEAQYGNIETNSEENRNEEYLSAVF